MEERPRKPPPICPLCPQPVPRLWLTKGGKVAGQQAAPVPLAPECSTSQRGQRPGSPRPAGAACPGKDAQLWVRRSGKDPEMGTSPKWSDSSSHRQMQQPVAERGSTLQLIFSFLFFCLPAWLVKLLTETKQTSLQSHMLTKTDKCIQTVAVEEKSPPPRKWASEMLNPS